VAGGYRGEITRLLALEFREIVRDHSNVEAAEDRLARPAIFRGVALPLWRLAVISAPNCLRPPG
jgi:hypothetical protein